MYEYRILITGSRTWPDQELLRRVLRDTIDSIQKGTNWLEEELSIVIIHGAAYGADLQADKVAREMIAAGLPIRIESYPVTSDQWRTQGRSAGHIRNRQMVDLGANVCIAFIHNNSKGATNCARIAREAGIPVLYHRIND